MPRITCFWQRIWIDLTLDEMYVYPLVSILIGDAEFAEWKMQEWIYRHQTTGLENAGVEISGKVMHGKQSL